MTIIIYYDIIIVLKIKEDYMAITLDNHSTVVRSRFKLNEKTKITEYLKKSNDKSKRTTLKIKGLRLYHFLFRGFSWINTGNLIKVYKPLIDSSKINFQNFEKKINSLTNDEKKVLSETIVKFDSIIKFFEGTHFAKQMENLFQIQKWKVLAKQMEKGNTPDPDPVPKPAFYIPLAPDPAGFEKFLKENHYKTNKSKQPAPQPQPEPEPTTEPEPTPKPELKPAPKSKSKPNESDINAQVQNGKKFKGLVDAMAEEYEDSNEVQGDDPLYGDLFTVEDPVLTVPEAPPPPPPPPPPPSTSDSTQINENPEETDPYALIAKALKTKAGLINQNEDDTNSNSEISDDEWESGGWNDIDDNFDQNDLQEADLP